MRVTLRGALLLACLWLGSSLAPGPALAAAGDLFRVTGIPADATAANAVAAREAALDAGQREGLRLLLRRLILQADERRLPPVDKPDRYVQSFEIASEKVAPTRYIATLNVSYAPDQVRALLRRADIPFLDRRPDPVLVLPVLLTEQGPDLWGEDDPWRAAWNAGVASPLVELRLPLGDAGDISGATPAAVTGNDTAALSALGQRYGTALTVVAQARLRQAAGGTQAVELEVRPADAPDQPFLRETVAGQPGEDQAALLARAAARAVTGIEAGIKQRLIVRPEDLAALQVRVPLADLASWVQIKRALEGLPEVRATSVQSFTRAEAVLDLSYAGNLDGLTGALQRAGLVLAEENGEWQLRQAAGQEGFPAPLAAPPASP